MQACEVLFALTTIVIGCRPLTLRPYNKTAQLHRSLQGSQRLTAGRDFAAKGHDMRLQLVHFGISLALVVLVGSPPGAAAEAVAEAAPAALPLPVETIPPKGGATSTLPAKGGKTTPLPSKGSIVPAKRTATRAECTACTRTYSYDSCVAQGHCN